MFVPLIIFLFSKFRKEIKLIAVYSLLAIIVWYFTPRTGGGRFILPYLPAFSIVCAGVYSEILKKTRTEYQYLKIFLLGIIIVVASISVMYRFAANTKYIPVVFGQETKEQFLKDHLNYSFGDFYDTDNYFKKTIKQEETVLLYGFHNLYYVEFPFIDSTWIKDSDTFDYVATQDTDLPEKFKDWKLIYKNDKTMVKLYKP
jgi:hypothetical protein